MIHIHTAGHLIRDPQSKTSAKGTAYVTCMLAVDEIVVNVSTFDEDLSRLLMNCRKGDALSVSGKAQISVYTARDGETKPSVNVTANRLLTAAAESMARPKPRENRRPAPTDDGGRPFDDDVAF